MLRIAFFGRVFGALCLAGMVMTSASCGDDGRTGAVCEPDCAAGLQCCGGDTGNFCRATASDITNCGGCGITCTTGQTCSLGACVGGSGDSSVPPGDSTVPPGMCTPSCSSSQRCCGTSCMNRSVPAGTDGRADPSFMNCNGCGLACDPDRASACSSPGGGAPRCMCGDFECIVGESCVSDAGTFRCVNTQTDRNNCGSVGNVCPGEEICVAGICSCGSTGAACGGGTSCCGGACIDTQSDADNCGACGTVCGDSGPTCTAGACRCGTAAACSEPSATSLGQSCCDNTCRNNSDTACGCGADSDCTEGGDSCVYIEAGGILPIGETGLCCGTPSLLPGVIPPICLGGGGFPGLDAGIPIP